MSGFGGPAFGTTSFGALARGVVNTEIDETLSMAGSLDLTLVYTLIERLAVSTSGTQVTALRLATLSETLGLSTGTGLILAATVDDTLLVVDEAQASRDVLVALVDTLRVSGLATGTVQALVQIAEALALAGAARSVMTGDITDAATFADEFQTRLQALETMLVGLAFADDAVGLVSVVVELDDQMALAETLTPTAALTAAVREGLRFAVGFVFDGTPVVGLSLNTATRGVSTYSSYPFNSMTAFGGAFYGANDNGLYELDGNTDAGAEIVWRIRTGMTNLGTGRNKAMDAAYLGFTASGRVALKCIVVDASTGEKIVHWYELTETAAVTPRGRRLLVGRGLRSVYWGFELTNVTAGDIELDVVELHPIVLEGRL